MKKLLIIVFLVATMAVVSVGMAGANGGPHGNYTATTDACAGCHRAHTATGPRLLVQSSTLALCMSCHGTNAAGAYTNVEDGVYSANYSGGNYVNDGTPGTEGTPGDGLLAGGFTYSPNQGNTGPVAVSSTHLADGSVTQAWTIAGPGAPTLVALLDTASLTCASCHDPHGSSNYRIIPVTVNQVAVAVPDGDAGAKDYTAEAWQYGQTTGANTDSISQLCAACHTGYHTTAAGSGSAGNYTHRIDVSWNGDGTTGIGYGTVNPETTGFGTFFLPLADDFEATPVVNDILICSTCHYSHGSSVTMSTLAEGATQDGVPGGGVDNSSALLRLDNRGVCEVCHQK